jgi:hypothetical protein
MSSFGGMMTGAIRKEYKPNKVLQNWRSAMQALTQMNEKELQAAIKVESLKDEAERRKDILWRLHRRYCVVRQDREMEEIGIKDFYEESKSRASTTRIKRS